MSDRLTNEQIDKIEQAYSSLLDMRQLCAQAKLAPSELANVGAAVRWMTADGKVFEQEMLALHHADGVTEITPLYTAPTPAAPPNEGVLTADVRVGSTLFRKGVSVSTMQGAIDRQINDYLTKPMTYYSTEGCTKHHGQSWTTFLHNTIMPTKVCPLCNPALNAATGVRNEGMK